MINSLQSFGQDLVYLVEELRNYYLNSSLFSWLPDDIRLVVLAVGLLLLIVAIKRTVLV